MMLSSAEAARADCIYGTIAAPPLQLIDSDQWRASGGGAFRRFRPLRCGAAPCSFAADARKNERYAMSVELLRAADANVDPEGAELDYVARARDLLPLIRDAAAGIEAGRRLDEGVVGTLHEAGL